MCIRDRTPTVATDDTSYMGLELSGLTAKLVGIDGLTFGVYGGAVKVNKATAGTTAPAAVKKNWKTFTETSDSLPVPTLDVDGSVDLSVSGNVALDAFGFVVGTAGFTLSLGAGDVQ